MTEVLVELTSTQQAAIAAEQTSFLLGPAGTGKTAALQNRLLCEFAIINDVFARKPHTTYGNFWC